jgi:hypothetical protein
MPLTEASATSFKEGHKKKGGRAKGSPNRLTAEVKAGFIQAFKNKEASFEAWLDQVALEDPAAACKIMVSMADFIFPRIGRTELTGKDGERLRAVFKIEES